MTTLLIKEAEYVATFDSQDTVLEGADILIEGNRIKTLGKPLQVNADRIISGKGKIVLPGLVNTHHHLYQTLTRSVPRVQDVGLFEWLVNLYEIWAEITPEAVYYSTLVGLGELLLTGCTTSTDMFYVFPRAVSGELIDVQIKAASEIGIRFHPCRGSMSRGKSQGGLPPDEVVQEEDVILADCERLIQKYHDPEPFSMCRIALGPCSPFTVTPTLLSETRALSRKYGVRCHTHLAETKDEEVYCQEVYGRRPFEFLEELDWLGEDVWFAHCVHLSQREILRMAETKTGVAHCPVSNMRLGSGIAPLPEMLRAGVPVGLAVDGSASNDSSDMLAEVRSCLLAHRAHSGASALKVTDSLKISIKGGAKVLGNPQIGSIEEGKSADLVMIDLFHPGFAGTLADPLAAVVLAGDSHIVHTSIVNGVVVVEDGHLCRINEEELIREANKISREMIRRASARTGIDFLQGR